MENMILTGTIAGVHKQLEKDEAFQALSEEKKAKVLSAIDDYILNHTVTYIITHKKELKKAIEEAKKDE